MKCKDGYLHYRHRWALCCQESLEGLGDLGDLEDPAEREELICFEKPGLPCNQPNEACIIGGAGT